MAEKQKTIGEILDTVMVKARELAEAKAAAIAEIKKLDADSRKIAGEYLAAIVPAETTTNKGTDSKATATDADMATVLKAVPKSGEGKSRSEIQKVVVTNGGMDKDVFAAAFESLKSSEQITGSGEGRGKIWKQAASK